MLITVVGILPCLAEPVCVGFLHRFLFLLSLLPQYDFLEGSHYVQLTLREGSVVVHGYNLSTQGAAGGSFNTITGSSQTELQ